MRNAGLDEAQAGIKIAWRNINNLSYADDTTLLQRRTKEPLDESERGEWKSWLTLNIQKTKIMASSPITSWQIDEETVVTVRDFILGGSKITADGDSSREIKTLAPWKKSYDQPAAAAAAKSLQSTKLDGILLCQQRSV